VDRTWKASGGKVVLLALLAVLILLADAGAEKDAPYTTYRSLTKLIAGEDAQYPQVIPIFEIETNE
jgi:hypothetical protein